MKKLLLASTALVMTAGAAAAQVNMSGSARMGIAYDNRAGDNSAGANSAKLQFTSRIRVNFTMSGETDSGLAFGASVRGDQFGNANSGGTAMANGSVYIDGEFGRLTFGDVAGAARATVGDIDAISLTDLGDPQEATYLDRTFATGRATNFGRRTAVLYAYSIDSFTFRASVGQQRRTDNGGFDVVNNVAVSRPATENYKDTLYALGVSYSMDGLKLSAGYEAGKASYNDIADPSNNTKFSASHIIIGAEYEMEGFTIKAVAGRVGGDLGTMLGGRTNLSRSHYGLSVTGEFDATTVTAYARRTIQSSTNYGIGASYDLGGGATLVGGIARIGATKAPVTPSSYNAPANVNAAFGPSLGAAPSRTRADFGLNFSF
ncbi:porin [Roseinatronobacter sp. S2]|uniref:porin n=1 Tax=Roseinatronobacter sp. S2 TaxID=3035471 RepID=UPI0024104B0D|nr:porin [Roseinatronobacter sp. S2]WFE75592.1 porin [Roseinatronobacter sp. S2]